nr:myb domain protein 62 [Tanacetum cinerariifolium]
MMDPNHQKLKRTLWKNKVFKGVRGSIPEMEPELPRGKYHMEQRMMNAKGSQNNERMKSLLHHNQKISDHLMKSKNPLRIWYSGSGPGKGKTITMKESRALSANRKSRFNQRKLVFKINNYAGRIVRDDSQTFITKGGCVVRECAVFDGRT